MFEILVKKYPCLWDSFDPEFRNITYKSQCRNLLLEEINSSQVPPFSMSTLKRTLKSFLQRNRRLTGVTGNNMSTDEPVKMDITQATSSSCEKATATLESGLPCQVTSVFSWTSVCRICLAGDPMMKNIFETTESESISDRILYCTGVKFVQEDGLSDKICTVCFTHLTTAYDFKTKCLSADEICRNLPNELKTDDVFTDVNVAYHVVEIKAESEELIKVNNDMKDDKKLNDGHLIEASDDSMDEEEDSDGSTRIGGAFLPVRTARHCSRRCFCKLCGKFFSNCISQHTHMKSHREATNSCTLCEYKTPYKYVLKRHMQTHTEEKKFQCKFCSATFRHATNVLTHIKDRHSADRNYRFSCPRCDKQFQQRSRLNAHLQTHDPVKRYLFSTSNMEKDKNEEKRKSKKRLKQDSIAYKRPREKANARKRKFLNKMTPEQKEMKRLKDREYYQRKKAENKVKTVVKTILKYY